jgi:hypothetical protein
VDELFDLPGLEGRYAARYKGVGYGDSKEAVRQALGEPDAVEFRQAMGFFRWSYFADDVVIQFQDFRVKWIEHGVSPELKQEVREKGRQITRP